MCLGTLCMTVRCNCLLGDDAARSMLLLLVSLKFVAPQPFLKCYGELEVAIAVETVRQTGDLQSFALTNRAGYALNLNGLLIGVKLENRDSTNDSKRRLVLR